MKKQILSEEFKRMQKLAGIIAETQSLDDFIDVLIDMAIEHNIIEPQDLENDNVRDALYSVWDEMGFENYEETGQGISTSDYNLALKMLSKILKT